jgi:glutamine amidotransferase
MVGVVNYGMGNLHSIARKLHLLKADFQLIETPEAVQKCSHLILPGVGHFGKAMQSLEEKGLINALNQFVLIEKKPILGICLGMQLMAKSSEEGNVLGLGWVDTRIVRFKVSDSQKYKVPHIGWNGVEGKGSKLLGEEINEFYFVHSYHAEVPNEEVVLHKTVYDTEFISGFEKGNIFGVQYHPEKSHQQGMEMMKRFLGLGVYS